MEQHNESEESSQKQQQQNKHALQVRHAVTQLTMTQLEQDGWELKQQSITTPAMFLQIQRVQQSELERQARKRAQLPTSSAAAVNESTLDVKPIVQQQQHARAPEPPVVPINSYPAIAQQQHAPMPPQQQSQQHYNGMSGMYPPQQQQQQQPQYNEQSYYPPQPPQAPIASAYMQQPQTAAMYAATPVSANAASLATPAAALGGAAKRVSQSDHNQPCTTLFLAKLDALSDDELLQMLQNSFGAQIVAHKFMMDRHGKRVAFVDFDSVENSATAMGRIGGFQGIACSFSKNPLYSKKGI